MVSNEKEFETKRNALAAIESEPYEKECYTMAHTVIDFPTKKALKAAVTEGKDVYVERNMFGTFGTFGKNQVTIEGPHAYHKFYAQATIDSEGKVLTVK